MDDSLSCIVSSTEDAALAAFNWIGSGQKELADQAATEAMKETLATSVDFAGKVVMGEGKKDKSFGIFSGETVGKQAKIWETNPSRYEQLYGKKNLVWYDIAVDPIEGTTPTVTSGPEAMSVIALGTKGSMLKTDYFYMNRIVYGRKIKEKTDLSLDFPLEENLRLASESTGKIVSDLMVCVLNRERHQRIINKLRKLNVKIKLLNDCDVAGAVAACLPNSNVDFLLGIGGSPEAVISAAAIKTLGGGMEARIYDMGLTCPSDSVFSTEKEQWCPVSDIIPLDRIISGPAMFAATGITNGTILNGIQLRGGRFITNSVFMRSDTNDVSWITKYHGRH